MCQDALRHTWNKDSLVDRRVGNQLPRPAGMGCNMILWDVGKPRCFFVTGMYVPRGPGC